MRRYGVFSNDLFTIYVAVLLFFRVMAVEFAFSNIK